MITKSIYVNATLLFLCLPQILQATESGTPSRFHAEVIAVVEGMQGYVDAERASESAIAADLKLRLGLEVGENGVVTLLHDDSRKEVGRLEDNSSPPEYPGTGKRRYNLLETMLFGALAATESVSGYQLFDKAYYYFAPKHYRKAWKTLPYVDDYIYQRALMRPWRKIPIKFAAGSAALLGLFMTVDGFLWVVTSGKHCLFACEIENVYEKALGSNHEPPWRAFLFRPPQGSM